jgi:hypothetical protein
MKKRIFAIALIIVVVIAFIYYGGVINKLVYPTSTLNFNSVVSITDPAIVPPGTQALYVNYSSVVLGYTINNKNSSYYYNTSGQVNLMSLQNYSQIIATENLPINSTVYSVALYLTGARIEINNTFYQVNITIPKLVTGVSPTKVNGSISSFLLDFSPTVLTVYTSNSIVFVLLPYVRAVSFTGLNGQSIKIGNREKLQAQENTKLNEEKGKISIISASLSASGNLTNINVLVKDNSNNTIVLKDLLLFGNKNPFFNFYNLTASNISRNISNDVGVANSQADRFDNLNDIQNKIKEMRTVNFIITNNSSLILPFNDYFNNYESDESKGYILNPNQTIALRFSGVISFGNTLNPKSLMTLMIIPNYNYTIVVSGTRDSKAVISVNAS